MVQRSVKIPDSEVDRLLADIVQVENAALRASQKTIGKLRQEVINAYQNKKEFSAFVILKELHPILTKAAAISHVAGERRALLLARKAKREVDIEFDLLDKVAALLKKTLKIDIAKVAKQYNAISLTSLRNLAAPVERKVRETISDLIGSGSTLKNAIDKLDEALNKLGVGKVEENKLEAVFRTQLQTSFNAGRWQADQDPDIQEILWGYKYVTVGDDRVREEHAELDGVTLPKDDPFWEKYWPPNGWNCRCQVIPVFEEREHVQPGKLEDGSIPQPDEGFGFNPGVVFSDATTKSEFKLEKFSISIRV